MALQKSVTDERGVSANYWRIESVLFYLNVPKVSIQLELYVDAAARTASKRPLETTEHNVEGGDFTTYFAPTALDVVSQNPQERAYEYLKTLATPVDFTTGTTDV